MAGKPKDVALEYFEAIGRRDLETAVDLWEPGGRENVRGQVDTTAPEGVRAFLGEMMAAIPDLEFEVLETTTQSSRVAVRWRMRGTFCGAPYRGIAPTGRRIDLEGVDVLRVLKGRIVENNAYLDGMTFARQAGVLPEEGSPAFRRVLAAANVRTKATRRAAGSEPEPVADGVWVVRGGLPRTMNVYLVRETDGSGVFAFDAGIRTMTPAIARAAASLGGLTRVVLGHGHQDHRGAAPGLRVPVLCHPDEVPVAEGDGGYSSFDFGELPPPTRYVMPRMLRHLWDGGPVPIDGTVSEGDEVGGFEVVHLPGHSPGLIALWRASDGLALTTDAFYTLDVNTTIPGEPRLPHRAFTPEPERARDSLRKLADLDPRAAWPGHAGPVTTDVRSTLERAAAAG